MLKQKKNLESATIIDFGLATKNDVDKYLYTMCGTPSFIGPEVLYSNEKDKYDVRTDVFSLGVILYILYFSFTELIP